MLLHETAYTVLDDLRVNGHLQVPAVLSSDAGKSTMVELVSIKIADPD